MWLVRGRHSWCLHTVWCSCSWLREHVHHHVSMVQLLDKADIE
jgi:hypothetical protein